ncbi:hypothetical protein BDZ97DRAFT_1757705 [Flammula alnicola]|nr:hypothetical protein BDZ97DRAFT_1757705 [Flammula alnicola]
MVQPCAASTLPGKVPAAEISKEKKIMDPIPIDLRNMTREDMLKTPSSSSPLGILAVCRRTTVLQLSGFQIQSARVKLELESATWDGGDPAHTWLDVGPCAGVFMAAVSVEGKPDLGQPWPPLVVASSTNFGPLMSLRRCVGLHDLQDQTIIENLSYGNEIRNVSYKH